MVAKRLVKLTTLGRHYRVCGVNHLKRTILGCSQMLDHHFGVCFVKFGEEMKH